MKTESLSREFRYNGAKLTDPAPSFSLPQVRDFYANTYPEIVNAEIEGPEVLANKNVYTFRRAVGTKGAVEAPATAHEKIDQILTSGRLLPPAIQAYLREVEQIAAAHAFALLDDEVTFIDALHVRYRPIKP
jgi:PRTRC genetic system protein C